MNYGKMRMPGVEAGSQAWEACMIPLHYMRLTSYGNSWGYRLPTLGKLVNVYVRR